MAAYFHGSLLRFCVSSSPIWVHQDVCNAGLTRMWPSILDLWVMSVGCQHPPFLLAPLISCSMWVSLSIQNPTLEPRRKLNEMSLHSLPRAHWTRTLPWAPCALLFLFPCPRPLPGLAELDQSWGNGQTASWGPVQCHQRSGAYEDFSLDRRHLQNKKLFQLWHNQQALKLKEQLQTINNKNHFYFLYKTKLSLGSLYTKWYYKIFTIWMKKGQRV